MPGCGTSISERTSSVKLISPELQAEQENKTSSTTLAVFCASHPNDAKANYLLGKAYGIEGNIDQAITSFQKTLRIEPEHRKAYMALRNIYRLKQMKLDKALAKVREQKKVAQEKGDDALKGIQTRLNKLVEDNAALYLSEAKTYLLYQELQTNVVQYPEIEAHLRDMQDILKNMEESRLQSPAKLEMITNSIYQQIQKMRSELAEKQATSLILIADGYRQKNAIFKAIDALKEADAQIAKFYKEEDPTTEVSLLPRTEAIEDIAEKVIQELGQNYSSALSIHQKNLLGFQNMGDWKQAQDEQKLIEQTLENLIQLKIHSLWRCEGIGKKQAIEAAAMIPLYKNYVKHCANSDKIGDYYYCLACCYYKEGNQSKALEYAKIAEKQRGGFQVRELLEKINSNTTED